MPRKTIGQSGRGLAIAGLLACLSGPSLSGQSWAAAATDQASSPPTEIAQPNEVAPVSVLPGGKSAPHRSRKVARNSTADKSAAAKKAAIAPIDPSDSSNSIPPAVANANAQLTSTPPAADPGQDPSGNGNSEMGSPATGAIADADPIANAKANAKANPKAALLDPAGPLERAAPAEQLQAAPTPVALSAAEEAPDGMVASSSDSLSKRSTLLGELCIGIGSLLTMVSAARLFMAS